MSAEKPPAANSYASCWRTRHLFWGWGGAVVLDIVLFVSVTPIYEFDVTETNSPVSRTKKIQKNRWRVLQHEARLFVAGNFF